MVLVGSGDIDRAVQSWSLYGLRSGVCGGVFGDEGFLGFS